MTSPLDHTPQSKTELLELQTVMAFSAPDDFFKLPNALPHEQRNLEGTVGDLRRGINHVYRSPRHREARVRMLELLDKAYAEFSEGRIAEGRETTLQLGDLFATTRR